MGKSIPARQSRRQARRGGQAPEGRGETASDTVDIASRTPVALRNPCAEAKFFPLLEDNEGPV
ncbi:hypothetical protein GCM10008024_32530 [Allgaiera indica]|uniref:Uncharacterized protein n=1 Tax=Allgaiera indica TaxID=765699 RepID=A0AAN5A0Q7_9RHOB|nr:hypothetical protein GCM10008024_32530 [Allgaiera indica]